MACGGDLDSAALHPGYDKRLGVIFAQPHVKGAFSVAPDARWPSMALDVGILPE